MRADENKICVPKMGASVAIRPQLWPTRTILSVAGS